MFSQNKTKKDDKKFMCGMTCGRKHSNILPRLDKFGAKRFINLLRFYF